MASAARMVLKPSSHSSITGRRRCSHSNVAGGWTLLRTLGAPLTVARCSSSPRRCDSCELHHAGLTRNGLVSRACGTLADERGPERDSCASPEVTALSPFRVTYSWTHPHATSRVVFISADCGHVVVRYTAQSFAVATHAVKSGARGKSGMLSCAQAPAAVLAVHSGSFCHPPPARVGRNQYGSR